MTEHLGDLKLKAAWMRTELQHLEAKIAKLERPERQARVWEQVGRAYDREKPR